MKERVQALEEFFPFTDFFYSGDLSYQDQPLLPEGHTPKEVITWINEVLEKLETLSSWTVEGIQGVIEDYAKANNLKPKAFYMPFRIGVSGSTVSPPLFETMQVLGKEMVRRRLRLAADALKNAKPSQPAA